MALPLVEERSDDQYWNARAGENLSGGLFEGFDAAGSLGYRNSIPGAVQQMYYLQDARDRNAAEPKLSIEQLNERFNGTGVTFSGPESLPVANMIVQEHLNRQKFQRRMELASQAGGLSADVLNFAGGVLPSVPEMAIGGALVDGLLEARGIMQGASAFQRVSRHFISNAAGMLPTEAAATVRDQSYLFDTSISHSAMNLVAAGALGSLVEGLRIGAESKFAKGLTDKFTGKLESFRERFRPEARAEENIRMIETAANQLAEGKVPNVMPLRQWLSRAQEGVGPRPMFDASGRSVSQFVDHGANEAISGQFFNATSGRNEALHLTPPESGPFGAGQYGTNGLFFENAKAVNRSSVIHQFTMDNARLAPADTEIPQALKSKVVDLIRSSENAKELEVLAKSIEKGDGMSLREVYFNMQPADVERMNQLLRSEGYQGIHYVDGNLGNERNGVMVFPEHAPDVVRPGAALEGDPKFIGNPSPEEIQKYLEDYHADTNKLFHQPEVIERADERIKAAQEKDYGDNEVVDEVYQETMNQVRQMAEEGNLSPEGQRLLQQFDERSATAKTPKGQNADKPGPYSQESDQEIAQRYIDADARVEELLALGQKEAGRRGLSEAMDYLAKVGSELRSRGMEPPSISRAGGGGAGADTWTLVLNLERESIIGRLDRRNISTEEMNKLLDRLTAVENKMRAKGISVPEFRPNESAATQAPASSNGMFGFVNDIRGFDFSPEAMKTDASLEGLVNNGDWRPYLGARTRAGDPFVIIRHGGRELYAVEPGGNVIGSVTFTQRHGKAHVSVMDSVSDSWVGAGVGEALYRELDRAFPGNARPDFYGTTSERAWASWKKNLPQNAWAHLNELADRAIRSADGNIAEAENFLRGYSHMNAEVERVLQERMAGTNYVPDWVNPERKALPIAPQVEGMPVKPGGEVPFPYAEQVKQGEKIIKSLYTCIGGSL